MTVDVILYKTKKGQIIHVIIIASLRFCNYIIGILVKYVQNPKNRSGCNTNVCQNAGSCIPFTFC